MLASRGISRFVLLAGGAWVVLLFTLLALERWTGMEVPACLFKRVTGYPCPTCGSTRAMESLLHAKVGNALALNPLMTVLVLVSPILLAWWIAPASRGGSAPSSAAPSRSRMTAKAWNVVVAVGLVVVALNWLWVIRRGN